ncbi:MAG: hypothetical protein FJ217_12890 [Ignavibacteria bacterium]|nr:hypothetical protein [Ignavibacteria bacterium]
MASDRESPERHLRRYSAGILVPAFAFCLVILAACSSSLQVTSQWNTEDVIIDGRNVDWQSCPLYPHGTLASVGMKNDRDYLYVCLVTSNRSTQMQMLLLGFTVWFDPQGGKERSFGVRFPIGGLPPGRRIPTRIDPEELLRISQLAQRELEILGPGKDQRQRFRDMELRGLDARLGFANGVLTYELKVALHRTADSPFGIGTEPLQALNVGFETGEPAAEGRGQPPTSGRAAATSPRGGRGGRSTSSEPSATGGPAGDFEPLKFWASVQLAAGVAPATK